MENNSTQQEVLLMTGTNFASRQYIEKDIIGDSKNLPVTDKLKEACWNGLLKEMLPEIFLFNDAAKLYLWEVREASKFFALEMGEYPVRVSKSLSIDPYRFMETQEYN